MALTKPQGDMVTKAGTEIATTSGTTATFTGIPAGTTMIVITLQGVSTNGTGTNWIRLGDVDGIENTGYLGASTIGGTTVTNHTAEFQIEGGASAAGIRHGTVILTLKDASDFTWACSSIIGRSDTTSMTSAGAIKPLSAVLTQVQLLNSAGDTYDAGSINIRYF